MKEILIRMSDKDYEAVCSGKYLFNWQDFIRNGMLLPPGHGDLKDANNIVKVLDEFKYVKNRWGNELFSDEQRSGIEAAIAKIELVKPIIEADNGELVPQSLDFDALALDARLDDRNFAQFEIAADGTRYASIDYVPVDDEKVLRNLFPNVVPIERQSKDDIPQFALWFTRTTDGNDSVLEVSLTLRGDYIANRGYEDELEAKCYTTRRRWANDDLYIIPEEGTVIEPAAAEFVADDLPVSWAWRLYDDLVADAKERAEQCQVPFEPGFISNYSECTTRSNIKMRSGAEYDDKRGVWVYKGHDIDGSMVAGGYTVFYEGDEVFFRTMGKAEEFIDRIVKKEKEEERDER